MKLQVIDKPQRSWAIIMDDDESHHALCNQILATKILHHIEREEEVDCRKLVAEVVMAVKEAGKTDLDQAAQDKIASITDPFIRLMLMERRRLGVCSED